MMISPWSLIENKVLSCRFACDYKNGEKLYCYEQVWNIYIVKNYVGIDPRLLKKASQLRNNNIKYFLPKVHLAETFTQSLK